MNMLGRSSELHIHCHRDLEGLINSLLNTSETKLRYPVIFHPLNFVSGDVLYENNRVIIESIKLSHRVPCSGFLFKERIGLRKLKPEAIVKYNIPIVDREAIKKGGDFCSVDGVVVSGGEPPPAVTEVLCHLKEPSVESIPIIIPDVVKVSPAVNFKNDI